MDETQRRSASWVVPLGAAAVVLAILAVVGIAAARDDEPEAGAAGAGDEPTSTTSPASPSDSGTTPPADTPTSSTPLGDDITGPAHEAVDDGFPAMVPAEVPPGWTSTGATYTPGSGAKGATWRVTLEAADGSEVVLTQAPLSLEKAVKRYLGADAVAAGRVDLSDWGTGRWRAYTVGATAGLAKAMPTETTVVIAAPDQDAAVLLAQYLLTAEEGDMPGVG